MRLTKETMNKLVSDHTISEQRKIEIAYQWGFFDGMDDADAKLICNTCPIKGLKNEISELKNKVYPCS